MISVTIIYMVPYDICMLQYLYMKTQYEVLKSTMNYQNPISLQLNPNEIMPETN